MKKLILFLMCMFFLVGLTSAVDFDGVVYYKFDTPTQATDEMGNYDGTNNGADNASGLLGSAYSFIGANGDDVDTSMTETFTEITMSFWMKWDDYGAGTLQFPFEGSPTGNLMIHMEPDDSFNFCFNSTNTCFDDPAGSVADTNWHHYAFVYDGDWVRVYVDGSLNSSSDVTDGASVTVSNLWIGQRGGNQFGLNGDMDEAGIWARALSAGDISDLYNGGTPLPFSLSSSVPVATMNSPTDNSVIVTETFDFNCTATDDKKVQNVSLYIDGTLNETNTSGLNNTNYIFTRTLPIGQYNWSCVVTDNESQSNTPVYFDFNRSDWAEVAQTYNSETQPGRYEEFKINVSYDGASFPNSAAYLYWNGTSYLGTRSGGGQDYVFTSGVTIPQMTTDQNITFYWQVGITNGTGTYYYNSTTNNQSIKIIAIDNCSTYSYAILNYSIYDEDDRSFLDSSFNLTSYVFVKLSAGFTGDEYSQYNFSTSANPITICSKDNLTDNQNYRLDAEIQFSGVDHVTEFYYIENHTINSSAAPLDMKLYSLEEDRSQEFLVTFKDDNFIPLEGAIIELTRKYLDTGGFLTVENMKTDQDGRGVGHFVLNTEVYTINVYKDGILRATYEDVSAFCDNILTGDCKINLNELGTTSRPDSFENYRSINGEGNYNDTTKTYVFTFNSPDAAARTVTLNITKYTNFLNESICSDTLTSSSGTLSCTIPAAYENSTVLVRIYVDNQPFSTEIFSVSLTKSGEMNPTRFILGFFLMVTLPLIAAGSPVMTLMFFVLGLVASGALFLVDFGGFIGAASSFLWLLVAIGILVWKINRGGL